MKEYLREITVYKTYGNGVKRMKEWKTGFKRMLVLLVTTVLVVNIIRISVLSVSAQMPEDKTGFPGTLTVTIESVMTEEAPKAGDNSRQIGVETGHSDGNSLWNTVIGTMVIGVSFYAFFAVKKKTKDVE